LLVKLESSDPDTLLLFDVEDPEGRRVAVVKGRERVVDAEESVNGAISQARRSAELLLETVHGLDIDEAELSFGLKLTGEAGLFAIARIGGETHCTVTLRWSRKTAGPSPDPMAKDPDGS
jgi:hypothetical protein